MLNRRLRRPFGARAGGKYGKLSYDAAFYNKIKNMIGRGQQGYLFYVLKSDSVKTYGLEISADYRLKMSLGSNSDGMS